MNKLFLKMMAASTLILAGCTTTNISQETTEESEEVDMAINRFPSEIIELPEDYYTPMDNGGTLENLYYNTYESFTYDQQERVLNKRAVVYLPNGYDPNKPYNVLYLMHGGWSNETTYMGSPENGDADFKHVMDHAIANGEVEPMIVVLPTYNNTSESDSGDYNLAIQLTNQYHNELINDLIPAVINNYSTYAEDDTYESIVASRDHRAFMGFSMGSVQTWRTFQYNLDAFRYFMPSSGNVGNSGEAYAQIVRNAGYDWDDFFIFAASGTSDFAYSSFKSQIEAMANHEMFRWADNEEEGNIYYLEKEGYRHDGIAAMTYFYNGARWLWKGQYSSGDTASFTRYSTVSDVINDPVFEDFGYLLFPVDRNINPSMTLEEVSDRSIYVWYNNIQPDQTVEIVNEFKNHVLDGQQIFYPIYSEEEIASDPSKVDTGLFFFRGEEGAPYAIVNAGGGFQYVGAMHDSFPHILEISRRGYHGFALIYRPNNAYEDLAQAITYIYDHAEELGVDREHYSLWGGSAGARMAAVLGNRVYLNQLTGRDDIPQADAVIMQYTGYSTVSEYDAPTYVNVGTSDGIANWRTMQSRLNQLEGIGIDTEFHAYEGLPHGYGIGTSTIAEGWIDDAINFWVEHIND